MLGSHGRRRALVAALVGAATLVGASVAQAAPTWLAPGSLTASSSSVPSVAAGSDASGNVVAAWVRTTATENIVEVAIRPAGGSFSVQPLQSATGAASNVTVAVNGRGDAIVAWRRQSGATSEIWASLRPAGGTFGAPQPIASVPGKDAFDPFVAINDAGAMMVVWYLNNTDTDGNDTIYGAFRPPGGSFTSAPISSTDIWNISPRVALDSSGRATVVWSYWDGGAVPPGNNIARVRVRNPDGTLGTQRSLSASAPTGRPMFATVGIDAAGNAVAVWSHWNGSVYDVEGATRAAASDTWTNLPAFGQSASASFGSEPQVAVDANGNAVAIWRAANGTIQAASRAAGGGFSAAQTGISQPTAESPRIVIDPTGNAIAIWRRSDSGGSRIESSVRPPGGQFGPVRPVSTEFDALVDPALSMDRLGNAFAVWQLDDPGLPDATDTRVQFAAYDSSAPSFTSVAVPPSGVAGTPASFAASAFDVWSPVSVSWNFGDGTTASGPSVGHAYGLGGAYAVTAIATDAVGNATSTTGVIQVATPQPPPPPPPPSPKKQITTARLSWGHAVFRRFTRLTRLQVKGVPSGSTVRATCSFKKTKCSGKARKAFTKKRARGTVSLNKRYKGVKLRAGTKITVRVTKPGFIGAVRILNIRKGKIPTVTSRCLPPGAKRPRKRC